MIRKFIPCVLAALALWIVLPLTAAPPCEAAASSGPTVAISIPEIVASLEKLGIPVPAMPRWVPLLQWQTYPPGVSGPMPPSSYMDRFPQYFPAEGVPVVGSKTVTANVQAKVSTRPTGTWVRDLGPVKVVLKITDDRLTSTALFATESKEWPVVRVSLDADYTIAKDGTLFGVVFGADATQPMYATIIQKLDGLPFAFGWRVDGDILTVRNLKGFGSEFEELPLLGNGRYTRMDESKLPEWEKKLTGTATPLMRTVVGSGLTAPPSLQTSMPNTVVGKVGMAPANPLLGTWLQEKDGMQVVLNFTEKRLKVEINAAFTVPGKEGSPVRFTRSMDADYSTSPDGTVFGILTGMDVSLGEGLPPEAYASLKEARRQHEKMIGAMFKFRMRMDGGRMTLSEERASLLDPVPGANGEPKADKTGAVGELFGGRFERVTGKVPSPKPTAGAFINQYSADPNVRIEQLQKEKDELRQQGQEWRKFWNNDMPKQILAPKCKDCVPPLKLEPGKSAPIPPTPMSRG